jgi:hypothetical protein
MTGPEHFRRAEELAAKAAEYLGQGDGQDSAAIWAAVAQVHATLAAAGASAAIAAWLNAITNPGTDTSPISVTGRTTGPSRTRRARTSQGDGESPM